MCVIRRLLRPLGYFVEDSAALPISSAEQQQDIDSENRDHPKKTNRSRQVLPAFVGNIDCCREDPQIAQREKSITTQ